jgi:tRNA G18 (ribose-2'-O)-methylase SpoU
MTAWLQIYKRKRRKRRTLFLIGARFVTVWRDATMIEKISIETLDLPELEPYRHMKWQFEQRQQGIFVAEGEKVVRRLLESSLPVVSALLLERWFVELEPLLAARPERIQVYIAERPLLEQIIGFAIYQGALAVGRAPANATLSEILARDKVPLIVAAEGISSAENIGGVVRNCVAFGASGIITAESSCSPYLRRAVRSSMGTVFKLPALEAASLLATLRELKRAGVKIVAAHPHANELKVSAADFRGPLCIVLGAEGNGISPEILAACDQAVAIPMRAEVDSLNVGAAGAVFLYEAMRQRTIV